MSHPVIHHTKRALNKPHYVIPIALGVALVIGVSGYLAIGTSKNYQTTAVALGTVTSGLSTTGTIKAATQADLAFPKSGRLASVAVKVGDAVYKGQTLASLDSSDAQGAVEQAQAAYQSAQANYQRLINGASASDIAIAQIAYDTTVDEQNLAVKTAYQQLLSSNLVATTNNATGPAAPIISGTYTGGTEGTITLNMYSTGNAGYWTASGLVTGTGTINFQTPQPIGTSGLYILFPTGTASGYASSTWSVAIPNTSSVTYTANSNAYKTALQTQTDMIEKAQAALDKVKAAPRSEDVAAAQAQVSSAQGALDVAKGALANDFIVAPIDGVITSVNDLTTGEIVSANTPTISIMSSDGFQIESYVSEKDLSMVSVGEPVQITTDAYGPSIAWNGTVIQVAPAGTTQSNGALGYKVVYQITDKDARIKAGLSATVNLIGTTKTNVLSIPRTAVFLKDGASFVLVKNGKNTEERAITTGLVGDTNVEVVSGLQAGEQIVTLGQ